MPRIVDELQNPNNLLRIQRIAKIALGVVLLIATALSSYVIVESGHVGVVTTFGAVNRDVLDPGPHLLIPFVQSCHQMETRLKAFETPKCSAASHDLQMVHTVVTVQHFLIGARAADSYQGVGDLEAFDAIVVEPSILEAMKAITARYTAEELVTQRDAVKQKIVETIQANIDRTLESKDLKGALHIDNVAIKDFEFSPEFNASIEAKVRAAQEALTAQNQRDKRITQAQAAASERRLNAEGEAAQITQNSIAKADAITREAKALAENPHLVDLRFIERWKGRLPTYNGNTQMFPIPSVLDGDKKPAAPAAQPQTQPAQPQGEPQK